MVRRHIAGTHIEIRALCRLGKITEVLRTSLGEFQLMHGESKCFAYAAYLFYVYVMVDILWKIVAELRTIIKAVLGRQPVSQGV